MTVQTWLVDISRDECAELLASAVLGRIAVVVDGRPEIFPVNHVYDRRSGTVAFPTRRGTKLHGATSWPYVAFEVDGLEHGNTGGWSVALVGRAEEIADADEVARLRPRRHVLWGAGPETVWLRIVPEKLTGRRISAVQR